MSRNEGPIIQTDRANPGRSIVVKHDPRSAVTPASLLVVPAQPGDPVGQATVMEIDGSDDESQVMTITLVGEALEFPIQDPSGPIISPAGLAGQARPIAKVEWGVAGVQAIALVDYLHGLSFSVPASWIRITGINPPIPLLDPFSGDQNFARNIRVGAFCSYGSVGRSGGLSAKFTRYLDVLIPVAGSQLVPIPPFATNFVFLPQTLNAAGTIVQLSEQHNSLAGTSYTGPLPATDATPVELVGGASSLRINNAGPNPVGGAIIFGISI